MDENTKPVLPTEEELAAEKSALEEVKEDEVRKEVISKFGFDEEDDADKIKIAVEGEIKSRKTLSKAIGQKVKFREDLAKKEVKPDPPTPEPAKPPEKEDLGKKIGEGVNAALEQRDLDSLEYPEELKEKIKQVAAVENISIKKAISAPYIQSLIEEHDKQKKVDEAAAGRTNTASGGKKGPATMENPPDVDMTTKEGREAYESWKTDLKNQGV